MEKVDFLIIGAGIAGASVGYELASYGKVAVLEQEISAGYHTTGRSAAAISMVYVNPVVQSLGRASLDFFLSPPTGFAEENLTTIRPYLFPAQIGQEAAFDSMVAEAKENDYRVDELSAKECLDLCPVLRPEKILRGIFDGEARDLDVHALHHGYLRAFKARGGVLFTRCEVTSIRRSGELWQAFTANGAFEGRFLINAAGAWGDRIAVMAGAEPIGLRPLLRTAFTFDAPEGVAPNSWPFVYDVEDQFYFKLENGTILASPANETESPPCDASPDFMDIAVAADRIQNATTLEIKHIRNKWAGLRTFAPDRVPVIGFDTKVPNFLWLVGQGGIGIMTAPAAAAAAGGLILNSELPRSLLELGLSQHVLSPSRFASVTKAANF